MTDTPTTPTASADGDFADILGTPPTDKEKADLAALEDGGKPAALPPEAAARIAELEAQLAQSNAERDAATIKAATPAPEKSPEQKALEHAQATAATKQLESAAPIFETPTDGDDVLTIHFLESGLSFADRVWEKGQVVSIPRNGLAWQSTVDRAGNTWLEDISISAQMKRWGKIFVAEGEPVAPVQIPDDLLDPEERQRGTAAPVVALR